MKKIIGIFILLALIATSCQKEEKVGGTAVEAMAGEWYTTASRTYVDGDGVEQTDSYDAHFFTYNTAANTATEIWLDDAESFWQFKGKVNVDLNSLTFASDAIQNEYYDMTFDVLNGKILKGAAKGPGSDAPTDSIYFEVKFSDDDPDITAPWVISGFKKTGFLEDEP
ncbi:lipid-binding protein [Parapedobacter lycopersici]|uniref:lipid-binding protein n=1 Tax=Parapedobacter lycopersici TaxID=1864939 RepID=UPI00334029E7